MEPYSIGKVQRGSVYPSIEQDRRRPVIVPYGRLYPDAERTTATAILADQGTCFRNWSLEAAWVPSPSRTLERPITASSVAGFSRRLGRAPTALDSASPTRIRWPSAKAGANDNSCPLAEGQGAAAGALPIESLRFDKERCCDQVVASNLPATVIHDRCDLLEGSYFGLGYASGPHSRLEINQARLEGLRCFDFKGHHLHLSG
ncbi:hypothetical protein [Mesorhizobium sp. LNHC221B00]|uniref:hypothetical protein n=1 Tax=Mesorhizobium sp. LNHC221B00 TaxID=1287233 RepID=UPI0012EB334F